MTDQEKINQAQEIVRRAYGRIRKSKLIIGPGHKFRPNFAMQCGTELEFLVSRIMDILPEGQRNFALEIGLYQGGTHCLWREIFKNVCSVDVNWDTSFLAELLLADEGSQIVCANSQLPETRKFLELRLKSPVDFLFIDGGHLESEIQADYDNYEPLVRKGGMIVFHDTNDSFNGNGVQDFLTKMLGSRIEGLEQIHHYPGRWGISFYVKR